MTLFKRITAAVLLGAVTLTGAALTSCGSEKEFSVTVKDHLGNTFGSGVIVKFMQNGSQAAMQALDEDGVAKKTLAGGEYDIELSFTDTETEYHYKKDNKVTSKEPSAEIVISKVAGGETTPLSTEGEDYEAYTVTDGCTYVKVTEGKKAFFLFTPLEAGTYEFSVADGANCDIGYHGAPHYIQTNLAEVKDKKFTISVSSSMIGSGEGNGGTSIYVLSLTALDADTKNAVLGIQKIGDPQKTIEDEPWTIYTATHKPTSYTLPEGAQIKEFDLTEKTDAYKLVYNEEDEFYHLNSKNGPLVLVRLGENCDYIDCFETILDRSGVVKYFFDGEPVYENFVRKEDYSECLLDYIECDDENLGVYPLTKDLEYIIKQRGDYAGWWDPESPSYRFKDPNGNNLSGINNDIAWLLMCCYVG